MKNPQRLEDLAASVYGKADSSQDERRRHKRTALQTVVKATLHIDDRPPVNALVRDLSRGGIGLTSPIAIRRGMRFMVTANFGAGQLKIECKCVNCRLGDDNRYIIGTAFAAIEQLHTPTQP